MFYGSRMQTNKQAEMGAKAQGRTLCEIFANQNKRRLRPATKANRVFEKVRNEPFDVLRILRDKLELEMNSRQQATKEVA